MDAAGPEMTGNAAEGIDGRIAGDVKTRRTDEMSVSMDRSVKRAVPSTDTTADAPPTGTPGPNRSGVRVQGSGCRVQGSGFRVQG
jgi:hypothetical protein